MSAGASPPNRSVSDIARARAQLQEASYSTAFRENVPSVPPPQTSPVPLQLEENVIQSHNPNCAQAAHQGFQSFLAKSSVDQLPSLRTLLLGLLKTNIGVKTFCEQSGISFGLINRELAGTEAQQFLLKIFPYFRQAITMKNLNLNSLHESFANIQLTVLPLKHDQLNAESVNNFEELMRKVLKTKQSVDLFKLLINKCLTLTEFLAQTFPDVFRSQQEIDQVTVGFDQFKVAVRFSPARFESLTTELEKSILQTSGEKILIEKLHTLAESPTKRGYLADFHKAWESSDPEMVRAFTVTYFENNGQAHEAVSALMEKIRQDRTVPLELCLPPPTSPTISEVTQPEVRGGTAGLPKRRGRPLGWRKPQPVSVSAAEDDTNTRTGDLQTPPPLPFDQPRCQPTPAPASSTAHNKTRKKGGDVNNIVYSIFGKKLTEATSTRRSLIKPQFIRLLNKEIDLDTFLNETKLIDSKARSNEQNMKSLRYAFPQFLDLFKENTVIPKDLHWSFADIRYDSDQERCILVSESRRNSSEQSSEAVVPPPIITSSSSNYPSSSSTFSSNLPLETNPALCLDFLLLASWGIAAFGKERLMRVIFTSSHLIFVHDPAINLADLTEGLQLHNKLFPDRKSGKLWFPGSKSGIFFHTMDTLEDFENLFLNRHGVSEKMFLLERGTFQELMVQYEMSSGPGYDIMRTKILLPEDQIGNETNLSSSLLKETFGTDQRNLFRGYIRRFPNQSIFGVLLSEFLLISRSDQYHSFRDSMFAGEEVKVRICKINQNSKLKLIYPIQDEDQLEELRMRIPELKMANILETEEEISASCLGFLNNNVQVAIPKSQWNYFHEFMKQSTGLHFNFDVKKIKLKVECVAKYSFKLSKTKSSFYAYYLSKGESERYETEDIHKLEVFVVPCRDDEEIPPEKYNIKAGVYIERLQDRIHSVKLIVKENSTSKTEKVRLFLEAKYVSQAHLNLESMLTRVDLLTMAIEHR